MAKKTSATQLLVLNVVGLTPQLLPRVSSLQRVANAGWSCPLQEDIPAVTCTAQASLLTGTTPNQHGIVANGWLFRGSNEIRFWQQNNKLIQAEPLYQTAKKKSLEKNKPFTCAKLFWWFNQGAHVDWSVTPKPHYGADGNKVFGIQSTPADLADKLENDLGTFPFHNFWGPMAGGTVTEWIAQAALWTLENLKPNLTLAYLPHLDYDPQRFGPAGCNWNQTLDELDSACEPLIHLAEENNIPVWIVSEYGHGDVDTPIYINRALREKNLLQIRSGPFGEMLDLYASQAFAVCDHQLAHVYVSNPDNKNLMDQTLATIKNLPGVDDIKIGDARADWKLDHPRSGEILALSKPNAWFAYPYWLDDAHAPDFARTIDIHRKPGFDPCEMFFDPKIRAPKLKAAWRLLQKKLGFRTLFDVVPLEAKLVKGSHGRPAHDPNQGAVIVGHGPKPDRELAMADVRDLLLAQFGLN